jgi:serine/threonine protein phosphatase family protein
MVRLIHTADLHLDSAFSSRFSKEEAEERRRNLLIAWNKLLQYGIERKVQAILISGDLFDSPVVSRSTMEIFLSSIRKNPEISFFYLRGNHDTKNTFRFRDDLPKNLFLFSKEGKKYRLKEKLVLLGQEFYGTESLLELPEEPEELVEEELLSPSSAKDAVQSIWNLKEEDCNILMLHGALREGGPEVQNEQGISLKQLSRYPIHYLALGHIHKREEGKCGSLYYIYPGCLQGRGFDEEGEKGFYYLEIEEETKEIKAEFVPLKEGEFRIIPLFLSEEDGTLDAEEKIRESLKKEGAEAKDSVRIILKGEKRAEEERNLRYLEKQLEEEYAYIEIKEETKLKLRKEEFIHEKGLKGEFLRMVCESESLSEEEKEKLMILGIGLLQGEEL